MGHSRRVLLVTNDFPPTVGGIQTYLHEFVQALDPDQLIVFASTQDENATQVFDRDAPFTIIRWPRRVMLPTPMTARRMHEIIRAWSIDTVWFGASAPLALMASAARRAGARRIVASTHGHEIGWSMIPGVRQVLRLIGSRVDMLTYVSKYAQMRTRRAFGPHPAWSSLQPGVDITRFSPNREAGDRLRLQYGLGDGPLVVCISRIVPRKGQDMLVEALPASGSVSLQRSFSLLALVKGESRSSHAHQPLGSVIRSSRRGLFPSMSYRIFIGALMFSRCQSARWAADWTSRDWVSSSLKPKDAACLWSQETVVEHQRQSVPRKRGSSSMADMSMRLWMPSRGCLLNQNALQRWGTRAANTSKRSGRGP